MRKLFGTADIIGTESGGVVTKYELQALQTFLEGVTLIMDANQISPNNYKIPNSPYAQDYIADAMLLQMLSEPISLAHFYSGMFSKTIWRLKNAGVKVTQTIAAHDSTLSREEFQKLGIPYDFPHLNIRELFLTYVEGQLMADKVICPSIISKKTVESYDVRNVVVIPHGIVVPGSTISFPTTFHVGYLGQVGPDKGLIYLLEAWTKLNLIGNRLLLAGRDSTQLIPYLNSMGQKGEIEFMGWVDNPATLYGRCSVYVQPSVTEGFGIEVLEAMSYGRPVIVSEGVGAQDVITPGVDGFVVPKRNPEAIADFIMTLKNDPARMEAMGKAAREKAILYSWDKIIPQYHAVWKGLLP